MHQLLEIWFGWVKSGGYLGIIVLMAMESSIFPVPSEVVIPPAAFLAAQGHLNFWGVVVAGTVGSYLGSAITYWVALWLGRPVVLRFGKYFFISGEKVEKAEAWVRQYGGAAIFFARLLPVVRHLISIPAGIVRMNFAIFSVMTITGSAIWCYILAYLGDRAYRKQPELLSDPEGMVNYMKADSHWIVLVVVGFGLLYALTSSLMKRGVGRRAA